MTIVGILYLLFEASLLATPASGGPKVATGDGLSRSIVGIQIGLIVLAMIVTRSSIDSIQAKRGLPAGNQLVGWLVLSKHFSSPLNEGYISSSLADRRAVASFTIPFLHSLGTRTHYLHRLAVIFLTFCPIFVILTISYEGLFYFVFAATIVTWVRLEHHIYSFTHSSEATPSSPIPAPKPLSDAVSSIKAELTSPSHVPDNSNHATPYRPLTLSDLRPSLFFFYLLQSAFFSTGNIASISSFSLDSVYRLIPIFDPFSQGALLMLKLLIPFAFVSANLGILNKRLGNLAPSALFMVVMTYSDVLTLNFFWMVRDEGSWLDIGTSISQFAIASLLGIFVSGLEVVGEIFVRGVEVEGAGGNDAGQLVGEEKMGNGHVEVMEIGEVD